MSTHVAVLHGGVSAEREVSLNTGGQVVAAMNVSTHAGRTSMGELRDAMLPILLDASARIGAGLRGPEGAPATGRRAVRADAQEA